MEILEAMIQEAYKDATKDWKFGWVTLKHLWQAFHNRYPKIRLKDLKKRLLEIYVANPLLYNFSLGSIHLPGVLRYGIDMKRGYIFYFRIENRQWRN